MAVVIRPQARKQPRRASDILITIKMLYQGEYPAFPKLLHAK
jgi:hypothetical protein